jgi:hypothetical protein
VLPVETNYGCEERSILAALRNVFGKWLTLNSDLQKDTKKDYFFNISTEPLGKHSACSLTEEHLDYSKA